MRIRNKQNIQISSNISPTYYQIPTFSHTNQHKDHFSSKQISPIRQHKTSQSEFTNPYQFQQFARSTSSIANPLCHMNNIPPKINISLQQKFLNTQRNLNIVHQMEDPQTQNQWKNRYRQLYEKYDVVQKKLEVQVKENCKLHNIIGDQSKTIKQLNEQNLELSYRSSRQIEQKNKWAGSGQSSFMNANQGVNQSQFNRYYMEELQRTVDNLQKENKRLADIVKRNMRNCVEY